MTKFHLVIAEHLEFGGNGIIIKSQTRDYFEPAMAGFTLAHDLLEHPVIPHHNGYVDELMALGGVIAGRIEYGWHNSYGRRFKFEDITYDICSLATASLGETFSFSTNTGTFNVPKCKSYLQDKDLMAEIKIAIRKGLLEAINELEDDSYNTIPKGYNFDIDSMAGHIAKGHQLFRKRFGHLGYNYIYLFNEITKQADRFIKGAELADEAILTVDFKNCIVNLEEFYGGYDRIMSVY